ncbi:hypothetical protein [Hymenobacter crusticola]|uniref:Uncharacterized protein n=1 Tax=Hymenobacter crusticola TaxID=1770526 RepID=A0A243W7T3_9BACT|nr:hypothetical protein [Hymenobacter crusticola]OUJ71022.1 hypothetical protein BXP70_22930 [Hymenobacter crusticola]
MSTDWKMLQAAWQQGTPPASSRAVQANELRTLVAARYRREQRRVGNYVVGSVCWQTIVYAALSYMALRFRTDPSTLAYCGLGVLLYLPFTVVFVRQLRGYTRRHLADSASGAAVHAHIVEQYEALRQFFSFKKRFDLIATPVTALVMVGLFIRLSWVPAFSASPTPSLLLGGLIVGIFALALRWENNHQFAGPLQRLYALRQDLDLSKTHG